MGIFLAFDGQLNARLVKTAEQNVPRAKGRGEVSLLHAHTHTHTHAHTHRHTQIHILTHNKSEV